MNPQPKLPTIKAWMSKQTLKRAKRKVHAKYPGIEIGGAQSEHKSGDVASRLYGKKRVGHG